MIRLLLCILLLASPSLAKDLVPLADHIGKGMADEAGRGLLDENSELTTVITRAPSFAVTTFAPPGHEADVCNPAMGRPILNDPTPFLFKNDKASQQKFYAIPGQPWRTKLELVNYDGGHKDYSGFKFLVEFIPSVPVSTVNPYLLDVSTIVTETTVDGVATTTWLDFAVYQMKAFPYGYSQGQYFPLPAGWQDTFDPCTDTTDPILFCRWSRGPWPSTWTGTSYNGIKTWQFMRTYLYHEVINYAAAVPIPVTATVIAQPGTIEISMPAEQTTKMQSWQGSLRLSVIYPEPPLIVTEIEQVGILDETGRALFTEAELELFGLGPVSHEVAQANYNPLNGLPMMFIP